MDQTVKNISKDNVVSIMTWIKRVKVYQKVQLICSVNMDQIANFLSKEIVDSSIAREKSQLYKIQEIHKTLLIHKDRQLLFSQLQSTVHNFESLSKVKYVMILCWTSA